MIGTSSSASRAARSSAEPPGPTLDAIVGPLTPLVLEVVTAPRGLDAPVGDVVIRDPLGGAEIQEHDIVLAVGVAATDHRQMTDVLQEAGARAAVAVIIKAAVALSPALIEAATDLGTAVLTAPPETSWAQLHSLLRTAIDTTGMKLRSGHDDGQAGDLFSLANAVAAMVGGPVTLEDPQSRVLAYSNLGHETDEARRQTILGRRIPDEWMERLREEGFFARLWSSDEAVQYDAGDNQTRLVIAVKAGGEVLGSIWVADGGRPFPPSARQAMHEAASMAALHMVRHRAAEDLERRTRGELLRSLLEGRGSVEAVASRLELDADAGAAVLAFALPASDEPEAVIKGERVSELVMTYCQAFRRRVALATLDLTLYVLLPVTGPGDHGEAARRLAEEIIDTAGSALGADLRAAIGSTVAALKDIPRSRLEADRVLTVLAKHDLDLRVAHVNDVHAHAAVLELKELLTQRPHLWSPKLERLIEHDAQRATEHVLTLRAYLDCMGDVRAAADQVHVHPNTFRYRLRRLVELSGLDLEDPDERLIVALQLRLV